jgi:hypothetical protein
MPNHAVLAIENPELLDKYEALYAGTTLTYYVLTAAEKKFVMLFVVLGCETPLGAFHVKDFLAAGGSQAQVNAALRLAMLVIGSSTIDAVGPGWSQFVPGISYETFFGPELIAPAIDSGVAPWLVELALAACHACRRAWSKVGFHLVRAKQNGASDSAVAEALTTLILTAGNPIFVQACGVWQTLIAEGRVDASPMHRFAAELNRG